MRTRNWYGIGSSLWEHPNATGQGIYVSANEDLGARVLYTSGSWTSWDHAVSSWRVTPLW
jgi:hypothetical protein